MKTPKKQPLPELRQQIEQAQEQALQPPHEDPRSGIPELQVLIRHINQRFDEIEELLKISAKPVLTTKELSKLTGLKHSTLNKLACQNKIPHYKDANGGKFNYFDKQEMFDFFKAVRVATDAELQSAAQARNRAVKK